MEESSNILKTFIFFIIFVVILIGSYFFFTRKKPTEETPPDNSISNIKTEDLDENIKIDQNKDIIYYEVLEVISENIGIINQYPIININTEEAKNITEAIKTKVEALKDTLVLAELEEEKALCEDSIKEVKEINYEIHTYKNYLTLVVLEGTHSCFSGSENIVSSYTFDTKTGELIPLDELLTKYNKTLTNIKQQAQTLMQERLDAIKLNDPALSNFIKITDSLNNFETNKTIIAYINNKGELMVNFVVLTEEINYNETMTIK